MLLEQLLDHLSVSVEPFALCEVERGCRLDLDERDTVTVHFVLRGAGTVSVGNHLVNFAPHCLVLIPHRRRHVITALDVAGTVTAVPSGGLMRFTALGEHGVPDVVAACGHLHARYGDGPALFGSLVEPIAVDFAGDPDMEALFSQILAESSSKEYGAKQMLAALMTRCLMMVFRRLCTDGDCPFEWLNALEDPRLAAALDDILTKPGHRHSLESLAATATMSRSAFADSFRDAFGSPPMTFLRNVRLRTAATLLRSTTLAVGTIGAKVGYSSRAHFTTAFRHHTGMTPNHYRQQTPAEAAP